jgi:hypothetical protein
LDNRYFILKTDHMNLIYISASFTGKVLRWNGITDHPQSHWFLHLSWAPSCPSCDSARGCIVLSNVDGAAQQSSASYWVRSKFHVMGPIASVSTVALSTILVTYQFRRCILSHSASLSRSSPLVNSPWSPSRDPSYLQTLQNSSVALKLARVHLHRAWIPHSWCPFWYSAWSVIPWLMYSLLVAILLIF